MKKKRGQISIEYLMIFGLTILILIPAVLLFRNFAFSSGDEVVTQRIKEISYKIIDVSREVHYYGPPSKKIIKLDMPPNIDLMGIMFKEGISSGDDEFILAYKVIGADGPFYLYYDSEIPIYQIDTDNYQKPSNCDDLHPDCGTKLECNCFPTQEYLEGIKYFNVESTDDDINICIGQENYCVKIDEVSSDLS